MTPTADGGRRAPVLQTCHPMAPQPTPTIGDGQHLALVDEIHLQRLQNLRLHKMTDASLRHHLRCVMTAWDVNERLHGH